MIDKQKATALQAAAKAFEAAINDLGVDGVSVQFSIERSRVTRFSRLEDPHEQVVHTLCFDMVVPAECAA